MYLNIFKHLLPRAKAWSITQGKRLREFFEGLSGIAPDFKEYIDDIWLDIFPQTTRELDKWDNQFYLGSFSGTEQQRRDRLAAAWQALGDQDPKYIQDTLQANGFDVYIHEWWTPATAPQVPAVTPVPRDPTTAVVGSSYMLVNIIIEPVYQDIAVAGEALMQAGESVALAGNQVVASYGRKVYPVPTDPLEWPFVLYFGGSTFPNQATVPVARKDELERLVLKLCPAQQWLGMLINYV